ncbi:hypothetical protein [Paludisphaera borealis]|uniref:hypothetical protein n=1 Tax=Paludisphaera borealis TaxID=1387353 RepID=UPI0011AB5D63|nr:hypothetical protein [Paludisphaera borealis]
MLGNAGLNAAQVLGSISANPPGTTTALESASINVIDTGNSNPPALPTGTGAVTAGSDLNIKIFGTGNGFVAAGTASNFIRNYVLADTVAAGGPAAFVEETFSYDLTATGGNIIYLSNLTTPALTVRGAMNQVTVGSAANPDLVTFPAALNSGIITTGQEKIKYNFTTGTGTVHLDLTATLPVGALPGAGSNPNGTAIGVPWGVQFNNNLGQFSSTNATADLRMSYSLQISNNPFQL